MLILKVARECDQGFQEVHDSPQSMLGLESYVKRVETSVTSEGSDAAPQYVGVWGMRGVGKTLVLPHSMGAQRYMAIFKERSSFGAQWGKFLTEWPYQSLSEELGLKPELNGNAEDCKLKLHSQLRWKECSWFWMMFGKTKHLSHLT
jgi:hypothetical protein